MPASEQQINKWLSDALDTHYSNLANDFLDSVMRWRDFHPLAEGVYSVLSDYHTVKQGRDRVAAQQAWRKAFVHLTTKYNGIDKQLAEAIIREARKRIA